MRKTEKIYCSANTAKFTLGNVASIFLVLQNKEGEE